jgi:multisubunit Na+/H+ antiporter MnhE subunit
LREGSAWFVLLAGFYFALVTEHDWPEIVTGLVAAVAGAAVAVASGAAQRGLHRPAWRWSAWLIPLPLQVVTDTFRLAVLLARHILGRGRTDVRGGTRELRLNQPEDDARASALRAAGGWILSYSPCSYVVDVDDTKGTMLLHDLGGGGRSAVEERLPG